MGRSSRVCNFMTQTQLDPLLKKKKIVTQPNPPSPKNRPNLVGWVWQVGGFSAQP